MTEKTKEVLDEIHKLKGADQFIEFCDEIYANADQIVKGGKVEAFLKMNYIFAVDPGYGFSTAVDLFHDFVIEAFELCPPKEDPDEIEEGNKEKKDEQINEAVDFSYRMMKLAQEFETQKWNGLHISEVTECKPTRKSDVQPFQLEGRGGLSNLVVAVELIEQEIYLETPEMQCLFDELEKKSNGNVFIFHAPFIVEGIYSAYERVISNNFPVKVIHFTKPSKAVLVEKCKEIIRESNPTSTVSDEEIQKELIALENKNVFNGYKSLKVLSQKLLFNELLFDKKSNGLLPSEQMEFLADRYKNVGEYVKRIVKGQDQAINEIIEGLFSSELVWSKGNENSPKASFLLMGSPGVGKTLIAKTMAEALKLPSLILNMSDYAEENGFIDLVGSSKRFRHGSEGKLVQFVRQNAESIVVFDEIEKAHLRSIHLLLQLLDMGRLLDAYTEQYIDFSNTIVIFTTNAGKSLYDDERNQDLSMLPKRLLLDALKTEKRPNGNGEFFPQAICSRFSAGNVIMLNKMDAQTLLSIVKKTMNNTVKTLAETYEIDVNISDDIYPLFMYQEGNEIDARIASKKSAEFIKKEIYEITRVMEGSVADFHSVNKISFKVSDEENENLKLLRPDIHDCRVLYVGQVETELKTSKIKIDYVESLEEVTEALSNDYVCVVIDPYLGYVSAEQERLCINDIDSEGIRVLHHLVEKQIGLPIYMLDLKNVFTVTDYDSFVIDGASGCINASEEDLLVEEIYKIVTKCYITDVHTEFCNRGYCLDFSSRQMMNQDELIIEFYDLRRRNVPDAHSSKLMVSAAERPMIKLDDVIGAQEAKEQLQDTVKFLKEPQKMMAKYGHAPKGILLYGPPGTGKTMLAKALAGESDAAFISTSTAELVGQGVSEGVEKIKKIFSIARKYAPAIIFIDEIDAIGKVRTGEANVAGFEVLLNALLTEMDGFKTNRKKPVFVLAATNYGVRGDKDKKVKLDPALLRRFDSRIYVERPKECERIQYLELYREKNQDAKFSDETIKNIAQRSVGKSIADLENMIYLAKSNAIRCESDMTDEILLDAFEQQEYGLKKEKTEEYFKSVAYHEAGHAYIAHLSGNTPAYITITGRADFAGYVAPAVKEDKGQYSETELRWKIRELLAGRACEMVCCEGDDAINTGASNDLEKASRLAISMVTEYGFVKDQMIALPFEYQMNFGIPQDYLNIANQILLEEQKECERLISDGKEKIEKLVQTVLQENSLMMEDIKNVLS